VEAKSQKPKAKTPAPFFMNRQLNSIIPGNDGALYSPLKNEPIRLLFFGTSCVMLLEPVWLRGSVHVSCG